MADVLEEFLKWRTVHSYFAIWSEPGEGGRLLEQALKSQVGAARERLGRNACSTLLVVDAQSVKNTDTTMVKGYDAGKKVPGIKRHIAVDTQRLPHAVAVTTADVTDRLASTTLLSVALPGWTRTGVCGKIASAGPIPACSSSTRLSSHSVRINQDCGSLLRPAQS